MEVEVLDWPLISYRFLAGRKCRRKGMEVEILDWLLISYGFLAGSMCNSCAKERPDVSTLLMGRICLHHILDSLFAFKANSLCV